MRISDWSSDVCSSDLLTSITAWRDWESKRGQDPDFSNLDLLRRTAYNQRFKTFTQELRLQGRALDNRLDWLVGAYYSNETLRLTDDLGFGSDYGLFQSCQVVGQAAARPEERRVGKECVSQC